MPPKKTPRTPVHNSSKPLTPERCTAPACGRRAYVGGLCQTHHRQKKTTGQLQPIRPYRRRKPGTVKFAGLRLTPTCADLIAEHAQARHLSVGAALAEILEGWAVWRQK